MLGSGNEYLDKCQGTPAFLAPEMMRPHSRYRCARPPALLRALLGCGSPCIRPALPSRKTPGFLLHTRASVLRAAVRVWQHCLLYTAVDISRRPHAQEASC